MAMPFEQSPEAFHPVERPIHYASGGLEAIEAMEASMTPEAFRGFLKGNILKYVWRYEKKNGLEDLEKAKWYLGQLIFALETDQESEALAAIQSTIDNGCKDGFCPMPGVRYDKPSNEGDLFAPVDKA
jgi:hypothetical protein